MLLIVTGAKILRKLTSPNKINGQLIRRYNKVIIEVTPKYRSVSHSQLYKRVGYTSIFGRRQSRTMIVLGSASDWRHVLHEQQHVSSNPSTVDRFDETREFSEPS